MCCKQLMPDPDIAGRFYRTTFDWTPERTDMGPAGSYTIFKAATTQVGGMMARPPQMKEVLPHWLTYVAVTDCDGSAKKVGELGKGLGEGIKNFKTALKSEDEQPKQEKQA